jgi:phage N-6-adenine-methyltransferase
MTQTERQRRCRENARRKRREEATGISDAYGTPEELIDLVRAVMGGIDCDPASNTVAQQTVQAAVYHTPADNGLTKPWYGRVFLNPPYSRNSMFPTKLLAERCAGRTTEAIVLVNNMGTSVWFQCLMIAADANCHASKRTRFIDPRTGRPSERDPPYSQVFFYFGPRPERFKAVFEFEAAIGVVTVTEKRQPLALAAE